MKNTHNILYIVIPCYNESETLPETARRLCGKLTTLKNSGKISPLSKIVLVNDGSNDDTWQIIEHLFTQQSDSFAGISLRGNRGHQNALLAGLLSVRGFADMVISMDADLQDDIDAVDLMVEEYLKHGCDVVYGVRISRDKDSFLKRFTAESYYKLLAAFGCDIVYNHADYRLLSARAIEALSQYDEQNVFLRGLVPMLGFKSAVVEYERGRRYAGRSKYSFRKMLTLAFDGICGLSLRPLRLITLSGSVMLFIALALAGYSLVSLCMGHSILDWRIIVTSIWLVGGIITLSLGILGEYLGRAYMQTKNRPRYFIEKTTGLPSKDPKQRDEETFYGKL